MSDILLLDNFDSFTYNLVDILRYFGHNVSIYRNNASLQTIVLAISNMNYPILVFSPGPGTPKSSGCLLSLIHLFKGKIPMLGICLGHQALVYSYGGLVKRAVVVMHGKSSSIVHDQKDMFQNIPNPLLVARYHSLLCQSIPKILTINATFKNLVMSIKQKKDRVCGFQFHPESILTPLGTDLLYETIKWLKKNDI